MGRVQPRGGVIKQFASLHARSCTKGWLQVNGIIDRQDADFGSQYTVKEYHSAKYQDNEG